jgi:isoleucyl-tRNA synthetase
VRSSEDAESVHLAVWPLANEQSTAQESEFLEHMRELRTLSTLILEARQRAGIKVRQPLQKVTIKSTILQGKTELLDTLADEVNVKEVVFGSGFDDAVLLDTQLTDELIREGDVRELIRAVQDMRKQAELSPADRITLTVSSSDVGKSIVRDAEKILRSVAGTDRIVYENPETPREVRIRDTVVLLSLARA